MWDDSEMLFSTKADYSPSDRAWYFEQLSLGGSLNKFQTTLKEGQIMVLHRGESNWNW